MASKIGNRIPVINPSNNLEGNAVWSGFATEERQMWWQENGEAITINAKVTSFIEKNTEVKIPEGATMAGVGLRKDVIVQGKVIGPIKSVKLLTRSAVTEFEKKIHKRWPLVYKDGKVYEFTSKDIV